MSGILYIVATPIGNLEDITLRALRVLREVDLIAAEDTRQTKKLLVHYGFHKPVTSYYEHNERTKSALLVAKLKSGSNVALVSDAGTPVISDPGSRLIAEAAAAGLSIVPIPGPSALTAVLSASGLFADRFAFEGFLPPRRAARRKKLGELREERRAVVFYEAPHRIRESLEDLLEVLGDREAVLAREVTKIHEEFLRGPLSELITQTEKKQWRGEITLLIQGAGRNRDRDRDRKELVDEIRRLREQGMRVKEIAEVLGERFSCPKREIYTLVLKTKDQSKDWES